MAPSIVSSLLIVRAFAPRVLSGVTTLICSGAFWFAALGEGFRNPPSGSFGLGRAGGRFAHVDDASAVIHNPANLTDLTESEVQFTPSIIHASVDYSNAAGGLETSRNPWKFLPNFFAAMPVGKTAGRWAFGVGLTTPYGLSSEWNPDGGLRYATAHYAELITLSASPALAYKVTDTLRVGVAANLYWSQVQFRQFYPWALLTQNPAQPEGMAALKGDGTGLGATLGISWDIAKGHRLALSYRSMADIDYSGDFHVSNFPAVAGALGFSDHSTFQTEIGFPNILGVGYGIRLSDRARLEFSGEWVEFSRFDSLPLDIAANNPLLPSRVVAEEWRNTFTAGLAGDWAFAHGWSWRGGYQYYQTPVPDRTLTPVIPDSNQHVLTTGVSYRFGKHRLDLSYGKVFYLTHDVSPQDNPAFPGRYEFDVHLFSAAYSFLF